ncbi:unnamed protein product [Trifolium pratense]|uniref:Uncharacterized protein n=1 Tax=Trifolium pratense TaxID=57577 RepID=A0ACB0JY53_TRIPR|nr:unnamed protein product [Trifolium pratense]
MASVGYGLAETYVMQKMYKEKMKKIAQEQKQEVKEIIGTIDTKGSIDKTSSGCFMWFPKHQHRKSSQISDSNDS